MAKRGKEARGVPERGSGPSLWGRTLWHHYCFNPATGKNVYPADVYPDDLPQLQAEVQPVETFPVEVRGDEVFVGLPG